MGPTAASEIASHNARIPNDSKGRWPNVQVREGSPPPTTSVHACRQSRGTETLTEKKSLGKSILDAELTTERKN